MNDGSITPAFTKPNPRLPEKWYEYLDKKTGAEPATIEFWLDLANDPPELGQDWTYNFEIRDYSLVETDSAKQIIDNVRTTLSSVANLPIEAGFDPFDHHPFQLFLAVLQTVPRGRIRECVRCRRYFFARRKDQPACSLACANVARVNRYRVRWRSYEQNRKRNRDARKERKQLKAKRRSDEFKARPR
jgi:hypothetical protein